MDDVLVLARAQFGLNIGFHILFPSLTIALGWILLRHPLLQRIGENGAGLRMRFSCVTMSCVTFCR